MRGGAVESRVRAVVEAVTPCVDAGRFAAKRILGDVVEVQADVFADGHDAVQCDLLYRDAREDAWQRTRMLPLGNDRWHASFTVLRLGRWLFTVEAWVDALESWRRDLIKRQAAGQDLTIELARGAQLITLVAARAQAPPADAQAPQVPKVPPSGEQVGAAAQRLAAWALALTDPAASLEVRVQRALDGSLHELARGWPDPRQVAQLEPALPVEVDRERARFSSWYEMFPRSASATPGRRGTLADCEARLPYVAGMGFDVLYLPPIHPIGLTQRRGPNNRAEAAASDPGSPWAIGDTTGGHTAIDPQLGTLEDFRRLLAAARRLDIEIALDLAFQCSPDHPYVREHPEWFLQRPDGSIRFAENPPKQYPDIYPFHFDGPAWRELWSELAAVVEFWVGEGVRIFRVDNPHTKPFAFWEWLIARVRLRWPEVIFLAEAFTRPKVMYRLAKLGFSQSYTYFTWRNTRAELEGYFRELRSAPLREYLRPNLWPNTPDILSEYLQYGGRVGFMIRLVLAATLGASYGIYGPAFELIEDQARTAGSEDYHDSEKYQVRHWDLARPDSLAELIGRVNAIRRDNPCLQRDDGLLFHSTDNDALLAYSKSDPEGANLAVIVVNLDPHHVQSGWLHLDLGALGLPPAQPFQAHDLLSDARFLWQGPRNFVALDPSKGPAHILRVRRRVRSERDFDYFL